MKSNYLLIDYGNSYIKAAIYNPNLKKIVKIAEQPITINPKPILAKLNLLKPGKVSKIIESATANCKYVAPFNKQLKQLLKVDVKVLTFKNFKDDLKIKPPLKGKEMGTDLLCFAYYLKQFKNRSVIFSFGTVYLCFVCSNSSPYDCQFIPSISKGLKRISSQTAIAKSFIPFNTYKDTKGYSTYSCFQAGADNSMYAWVQFIQKKHNIKHNNIFITGGDAYRYDTICKKYKVINNLVLHSIALYLKQKKI